MQRARRRLKPGEIPTWHATGRQLSTWQKAFGIFLLKGGIAQLVITDLGEPIAILLQKPVRIQREDGVITGAFILNEAQRKGIHKNKKPKAFYVAALYDTQAKAFVHQIDGNLLPMVLNNKQARYLIGEERARVAAALTKEGA